MQDEVRLYVGCQIEQHAPRPFAHRRSSSFRFSLAAVLGRRQAPSLGWRGTHLSTPSPASLTARTSWVSNPVRAPGLRTLPSVAVWQDAFAYEYSKKPLRISALRNV